MTTALEQRAVPAAGVRTGKRRLWDPLIVFQVYMVLLVFSPSIYIVEPLGAAGTPATIFGCLILVLWLLGRILGNRHRLGMTSLHWILSGFALIMLASFYHGMLRPISAEEVSSSLRMIIALASGIGVALYATDSITTRAQLETFLRSAVLVGSLLAAMGVIQFFAGIDFVSAFHLPGLTANSGLVGIYERSGFPRVSGTAIHSIEFSAVVGAVLPLAGHFALTASAAQWWRWLQFGVLACALPLTIARSGAIALIFGLLFVVIMANRPQRWFLLIAMLVGGVVFRLIVPGLLGTIRSLFTGAGEDVSITGRVQDFDAVFAFVGQSPLLGRGVGTFIPSLYRTLDNQFLATAVEAGLLGVLALALLFIWPILTSARVAYNAHDSLFSGQALGVAAGIATALVLSFTFDYFGFPMAFGMLCLLIGASGAVLRIARAESGPPPSAAPRPRLNAGQKLGVVAVSVGIVAAGGLAAGAAHGVYEAREPLAIRVSQFASTNPYDSRVDLRAVTDILYYLMSSSSVRDDVAKQGVADYSVAIEGGSLAPNTDVVDHGGLMWLATRGETAPAARAGADVVRAELESRLNALQDHRGIADGLRVIADGSFAVPQVFEVPVYRTAAFGGAIALAVLVAVLLAYELRRYEERRRT